MNIEIWKNLPLHLSEKICNNLTKVRNISTEMKKEIEEKAFMRQLQVYYKQYYPKINIYRSRCVYWDLYYTYRAMRIKIKMPTTFRKLWEQSNYEIKEKLLIRLNKRLI